MKRIKLLLLIWAMLLPMMVNADPVEIDGIWYNLIPKGNAAEVSSKSSGYTGDITIPASITYDNVVYDVTSIGNGAFSGANISSISLPNTITYLGEYAFSGCAIKTFNMPNSVTSTGIYAFQGCPNLESITLSNQLTSISDYIFWSCSKLSSIDIPASVTSIGYHSFAFCSSLETVVIPNSVTKISATAFWGCSNMTSVKLPDNITMVEGYTFRDCTSLTSISIPDQVSGIWGNAFHGCKNLETIYLGSGMSYLDENAFSSCTNLKEVYCYASTPPSANGKTFEGSYIEYTTLHVPRGCVNAYKAVEPWKNFKSIVEMIEPKVELNKTKAAIEKGKSLTLKATVTPETLEDKSVTWTSSDTKIATVSSSGKVKGVKGGIVTITCTSNATGATATCEVTVGYVKLNETEIAIEKGKSKTLKATVYPSTLEDKSVTWTSSDTKIATVSSSGKVKGVKGGMATITCTSNATGLSATCKVTVGYVKLNETEIAIEKGKSKTLKSTVYPSTLEDRSVTWTSSDTKIATVSSSGKVKGVKGGIVTITCTSNATGLSASCKVTVGYVKLSETEITIEKGESQKLKATVYPSTLEDRSVTWTSSNTKIATVSSSGKVKGVRSGTATITCTSNATGLSESCTVTVLAVMESRSYERGIDVMDKIESVEPFDVYDLSGRKVRHQVTSLDGLPKGIYIVNGKKILKK